MVTLVYLSGGPRFPALHLALYEALNGNWSGLSYAGFGATYTEALAPILPLACLDRRKLDRTNLSNDILIPVLELDIDDNTFVGLENIGKSIAENDPAQMRYSFDLSVVVSYQICDLWRAKGLTIKPRTGYVRRLALPW